jgi:hypothetical protein
MEMMTKPNTNIKYSNLYLVLKFGGNGNSPGTYNLRLCPHSLLCCLNYGLEKIFGRVERLDDKSNLGFVVQTKRVGQATCTSSTRKD